MSDRRRQMSLAAPYSAIVLDDPATATIWLHPSTSFIQARNRRREVRVTEEFYHTHGGASIRGRSCYISLGQGIGDVPAGMQTSVVCLSDRQRAIMDIVRHENHNTCTVAAEQYVAWNSRA